METLAVYLPMDRRQALAQRRILPARAQGAALFADISGFTPLTETLVRDLGPQRGAEELTRILNLVYDAVIDEVHRFGGSVIAFAGDAITCWFDGDASLRATTAAIAMQAAMRPFAAVTTPAGATASLTMKAAVASGPVRRFLVGDPALRVLDAVAGETLARLAAAEHLAASGEVLVDAATLDALGAAAYPGEHRHDDARGETYTVIHTVAPPASPAPWTPIAPDALAEHELRPWLLAPVYERLRAGLGEFLAELRPTVALFLRFGGIDYDRDEQAGVRLDRYVRWVQAVTARYDGTLIDLNIGDKGSYLYINFGAPLAHENNAQRAAATALALRTPPEQLAFIGDVQIGISQGRMRAGAYGGASHRTYGVLGDEVNMAARLMMAAHPGQILVSQSAQQQITGHFLLAELPPIRVKGKRDPVTIYALTGTRRGEPLQQAVTGDAIPIIGRAAQLEIATQKVALAAAGQGQILGIGGEAGIGKSRLAAGILEQASARGFAIFGSECESYGVNSSYLVWQPVWRALFGLDGAWPAPQQIEHVATRLGAIDGGLLPRLPLLGALLQLEIPDNELTASLDAKTRKQALEGMLVDCLVARASAQPLAIVLEDCQWLDALSHDLLVTLCEATASLPLLFVYIFRPFELDRLRDARVSALAHHTLIEVGPLSSAEAAAFVRARIAHLAPGDRPIPESLVERITAGAEGNPFFLAELVNYLHFRGADFADPTALDHIALPDSLQRLVLSLVDRFSERQKITVKVASVVGRVFRAAWLWGAYPQLGDPARVRKDLETLQRQELLLPEADDADLTYFFRQAIMQGVTYESLPHAVKVTLHAQIGAFLESLYATRLDHHLDLLAFHYDRSENLEKRRFYLRRAGEAAQAGYANVAAIDYYVRLLPLLPPAEQPAVLLRLGEVLELIGDWQAAADRYAQALARAEAADHGSIQAQAQIAIGEIHRKQGQFEEASAWYARAFALAAALGERASVAKTHICNGTLAAQQGDYAAATEHYQRSLAIRRALGDRPNVANVLNNMAIVAQFQGDYAVSRQLHEEALAIRRALGNTWGIAISLNNLGTTLLDMQEYAIAGAYLEEALAIQRAIGDRWAIANALNNLGNVRRELGEFVEAQTLYAESLAINRALGDQRGLAYLLEDVGLLAANQGDAHRAQRLVGAAAAVRQAISSPLSPAELDTLNTRLAPARATLGPDAAGILAEGKTLTLAKAVELASQAR